jgi:hypothetical protein
MTISWLNYSIDKIDFKAWHIQLNAYSGDVIVNTYPVIFSNNPEIEETAEVTTQEKYIDEEIQQDEEGNDFVAKVVKYKDVVTTEKTGNMIPNPDYVDPWDKEGLMNWLAARHWFGTTQYTIITIPQKLLQEKEELASFVVPANALAVETVIKDGKASYTFNKTETLEWYLNTEVAEWVTLKNYLLSIGATISE